MDFINDCEIKFKTLSLLLYVKNKADVYFEDCLLNYCKKYNYQKIKISLISTIFIENNKISKFFIRIMIGDLKNIPNSYICGGDRFFEILLIQKDGNFNYEENISLIDDYFMNFVNKKISFKLLIKSTYVDKKNIFNFNYLRKKRVVRCNEMFSNCSGLNIKNHYSNFEMIFNRLLENGLLAENKKYIIKCFYYQSINENEKWELAVTINESEKWSFCYNVDDIKSIYKTLEDCRVIDKIIKDYDIFEMNSKDLKDLVNYSNSILY